MWRRHENFDGFKPVRRALAARGLLLLLPLALLLLAAWPHATAAAQGGGHTLYGDFKVDETKADALSPATFTLLLYATSGQLIGRQSVINNGRYRFFEVPNGEYDLVVESENNEVARVRVYLAYSYRTDHRQDIGLEMREGPSAGKGRGGAATVSAADFYKRTSANGALFSRAEKAVEKKEYDEAVSLLNQLVQADPKDFAAWTQLGTLLYAQKNHAEAEKAYLRAIEERPTYLPALINLGRLRMARKNFEAAVEVLARAVGAQPKSPTAHFLLGESYLQVKKGSKAVVHLNEAIRLDPQGRAAAHLRLATLYHAAGLKGRAAAEYEQFLAKRPDHPDRKTMEQYIAENKGK